jgi:hypothetical protein
MTTEPDIENLEKGTQYMTEAARLHLNLGDHATENVVTTALGWRFGLSEWDGRKVYQQSLRMLDAIGKLRKPNR